MGLYNGIDPIAIASNGVFTETYGSTEPARIANLYASRGYFELAPNIIRTTLLIFMQHFHDVF